MSEPIKAGDLVYVARDCCGAHLGATWTVAKVWRATWCCAKCGAIGDTVIATRTDQRRGAVCHAPLSWLRRIDPLPNTEREPASEEVHA